MIGIELQAFSSAGFNTIRGIAHVWIKPKSCSIRISVQESVKVEILEKVWVIQGAEIEVKR